MQLATHFSPTPDLSPPNAQPNSNSLESYIKEELKNMCRRVRKSDEKFGAFENLNADNTYISWGLFEDLIINTQFGHGKNKKDINVII